MAQETCSRNSILGLVLGTRDTRRPGGPEDVGNGLGVAESRVESLEPGLAPSLQRLLVLGGEPGLNPHRALDALSPAGLYAGRQKKPTNTMVPGDWEPALLPSPQPQGR